MGTCTVCGNQYDKTFDVTFAGRSYTFDSFECAIHELAPQCARCGCRILGHGVEAPGVLFCCVHCAKQAGVRELKDRTHTAVPDAGLRAPAPIQDESIPVIQ